MGWLSNVIGKIHQATKYVAPVEHWLMDNAHDSSTKLVNETSRLIERAGGDTFVGKLGATGKALSERDKGDYNGWLSRSVTSAATMMVGGELADAFGGGGGAAASGGTYYEAGTGAVDLGNYAGQSGSVYVEAGSGAVDLGATDVNNASNAGTATTAKKSDGLLSDIKKQATSSAVSSLISKAVQQKPPEPDEPQVKAPTAMPDAKQQAEARRRKLAQQLARRGRVSTIMTGG